MYVEASSLGYTGREKEGGIDRFYRGLGLQETSFKEKLFFTAINTKEQRDPRLQDQKTTREDDLRKLLGGLKTLSETRGKNSYVVVFIHDDRTEKWRITRRL